MSGSAAGGDAAAQIRIEAGQLSRMILDLLDLSKRDEGKLSLRTSSVDLAVLSAHVVSEMGVTARSLEVELESVVTVGPIRADEELLRRALTNLVENALRHAPKGSVVTLSASTDGNATNLRVTDTGTGVPPSMRQAIFDPFVQLDDGREDSPARRGGRGLGLAFCKLVAEAHGGRVWVEDAAPGAAFSMRIPHA
jgi:two-component system sensor histidine kinase/response regulator